MGLGGPKRANVVSNRWVLRIKRKPDGTIERYRARLVAKGFSQIHGVDYNETYAPVVGRTTVRLLAPIGAAARGLECCRFDIETAFLYGLLEKEVFMQQPEGFQDGTERVCLLKRSLYDLKQAPRQWNLEFTRFLRGQHHI